MADRLMMIRPTNFSFDAECAMDNSFASNVDATSNEVLNGTDEPTTKITVNELALAEFNGVVTTLQNEGIDVKVFEDTTPSSGPDAVFLNNWFSTHSTEVDCSISTVFVYPMRHESRQDERRVDIIETLQRDYQVDRCIDLSGYEKRYKYLEGTGSIVFDHEARLGYAALSQRTNEKLVTEVCNYLGYEAVLFHTKMPHGGLEIYHTNVLMSVGKLYVLCCIDSLATAVERKMVEDKVKASNKQLISITFDQMKNYAANILQVRDKNGQYVVVMSDTAFNSITDQQKKMLTVSSRIVHCAIPTIERVGGGGIRCMLAELYLPARSL